MSVSPAVRLLVCGNVDRADDGAAMRAVGTLLAGDAGRHRRELHIEHCGQLDILHLLDVPGGQRLLIVDAALGVRPGRVVTVDLDALIDHPHGPVPHSSHALPINQVLGVANVLAEVPLRGLFVGIGGTDFAFGERLSPAVARGLPRFVDAIASAIEQLLPVVAGAGAGA